MIADFDIAVIGSGFAGSLFSMVAHRLGRSVILIERGQHPRFVIGESSTPLANLLLEQLAFQFGLPRLLPLAKWGAWQKHYPQVACGLKRGFTFYHHQSGKVFSDTPERSAQLLVAASPHDAIADTHWYRPEFDHFLVREAQSLGVEFLDRTELESPSFSETGACVRGQRLGAPIQIRAHLLIDASGTRGYLHRALALNESPLPCMPQTQALFSHFTGVHRWEDLMPNEAESPNLHPPYPVDDAAVHHVFENGWIWVLRFNNGITSAGVAATHDLATELGFEGKELAWQRLLKRFPSIQALFADARPTLPFFHLPKLPFCSDRVTGPGWVLLPSSAGFIDPLLSTGFPLTLLGIHRLARIVGSSWKKPDFSDQLRQYERQTKSELESTASLVAALYSNFRNFELFAPLTLLYFAAASYSETVHRLGKPERASSFLLRDDPRFGPALRDCARRALNQPTDIARRDLIDRIYRAIEMIDVAGLSKRERRNWYPVCIEDLYEAAPKLGTDLPALNEMLRRCGMLW